MATRYHARSVSFPSRSHPSTVRVEEELSKLKTWATTSTSTSGSICNGLSGLEELYNNLDDLLNKASTQELLSKHRNEKCIEELVEASVKLLDICSIVREAILQFKEQAQALHCALRRRKGDSSVESNVLNYTCFRKKMKKEGRKLIVTMKQMDNKLKAFALPVQDNHLSAVVQILREVNVMNNRVFESLLFFLSTPVSNPKQSKWSLVSKLMHKGVVACEGKQETKNELESVDSALNEESMQNANKKLEAVEFSIEAIENSLNSIFRCLIKTRTSILNIFSQ